MKSLPQEFTVFISEQQNPHISDRLAKVNSFVPPLLAVDVSAYLVEGGDIFMLSFFRGQFLL